MAIGVGVSFLANGQNEFWKNICFAIGTSFIATGAAGMIIWVYLAQVETTAERVNNIAAAGLEHVYDRRAAQIRNEYATRLVAARGKIDIMGFGLKDFRRDYIAELGALAAKTRVRILLLDPSSPYAAQRDAEEFQSTGTIKSEIEEFIHQFKQNYPTPPPSLELRVYTCLPLVNIFRIDGELFWGPYLAGIASGNTITLRVSQGGTLYEQLTQHFDEIWDKHSHAA